MTCCGSDNLWDNKIFSPWLFSDSKSIPVVCFNQLAQCRETTRCDGTWDHMAKETKTNLSNREALHALHRSIWIKRYQKWSKVWLPWGCRQFPSCRHGCKGLKTTKSTSKLSYHLHLASTAGASCRSKHSRTSSIGPWTRAAQLWVQLRAEIIKSADMITALPVCGA